MQEHKTLKHKPPWHVTAETRLTAYVSTHITTKQPFWMERATDSERCSEILTYNNNHRIREQKGKGMFYFKAKFNVLHTCF